MPDEYAIAVYITSQVFVLLVTSMAQNNNDKSVCF